MITDEEFRLFRNLIYDNSGIYLKESRKDFLENRLVKRMSAMQISSPYWYYKYVTEKKKTELLVLLDILTVNETSFFRNRPQMDLFKNIILPEIIREKRSGVQKRIKIWSAGCSTGEEPYSIAMLLHEAVPDYASWDIKIFASDLSLTVLESANKAEYAHDKVHATVDDCYIARHFEDMGEFYRLKDYIRKMVVFDFHNLKNDNGLNGLDVIFCRNVMIYFDEVEVKRLIEKFYQSLNPGGYLLLGHAESIHGWETGFEFIYSQKGTAHRKSLKEKI